MVIRDITAPRAAAPGRAALLIAGACLLFGCVDEPRPRSYIEFMEDPIAREGTLARCNQDREATAADPECVNARRAASTAGANSEAARAGQREAESELKRAALRDRIAAQQQAARRAEEAAQVAAEAAYDSQWANSDVSSSAEPPIAPPGASYGAPMETTGSGMPPASASTYSPQPARSAQSAYTEQVPSASASGSWAEQGPQTSQETRAGDEYVTPASESSAPEALSYIEVPTVPAPEQDSLDYVELPPGVAQHENAEPEPMLEELSIPRPFRYPEPN